MDASIAKQIDKEGMIPPLEADDKPVVKQVRKLTRKRCPRGKRRNPKTRRCNTKCKVGYKRSKTGKRCLKIKIKK